MNTWGFPLFIQPTTSPYGQNSFPVCQSSWTDTDPEQPNPRRPHWSSCWISASPAASAVHRPQQQQSASHPKTHRQPACQDKPPRSPSDTPSPPSPDWTQKSDCAAANVASPPLPSAPISPAASSGAAPPAPKGARQRCLMPFK